MTTLIVIGAVVLVGLLVVALLFGGRRRSPEEQEAEDVAQIEALWGAEEAQAFAAYLAARKDEREAELAANMRARLAHLSAALDAIDEQMRKERET